MLSRTAIEGVRPAHAAIGTRNEDSRAARAEGLKFLACELGREHVGENPAIVDGGRTALFIPRGDFSEITDEEDTMGTMIETNDQMCNARTGSWSGSCAGGRRYRVVDDSCHGEDVGASGLIDQLGCHERQAGDAPVAEQLRDAARRGDRPERRRGLTPCSSGGRTAGRPDGV